MCTYTLTKSSPKYQTFSDLSCFGSIYQFLLPRSADRCSYSTLSLPYFSRRCLFITQAEKPIPPHWVPHLWSLHNNNKSYIQKRWINHVRTAFWMAWLVSEDHRIFKQKGTIKIIKNRVAILCFLYVKAKICV